MSFVGNPCVVRKGTGAAELVKPPLGEAVGQTYKAGEFVYLVAGAVTVCAADAVSILGIAQKDATGVTGAEVFVEPIFPEDDVEMVCSSTVTAANIGIGYGLTVASNLWNVDFTEVTAHACVLVRPSFSAGGAYTTKAIVHFLPSVCQSVTGA